MTPILNNNSYILPRNQEYNLPIIKKMRIFTYWHEETYPPLVSKCLISWKKHMPDWEIIIYNANTIPTDLDLPENWRDLAHSFFADILRLSLLIKHGGIWFDATLFLNKPLCFTSPYSAILFHQHYPENWCLVAPAGNPNMVRWLAALKTFVQYHPAYEKHPVYIEHPNYPWFQMNRRYYMSYDAYLIAGGDDGPDKICNSWKFHSKSWNNTDIVKYTRYCRRNVNIVYNMLKLIAIVIFFTSIIFITILLI